MLTRKKLDAVIAMLWHCCAQQLQVSATSKEDVTEKF
jgi:hypothetical protein